MSLRELGWAALQGREFCSTSYVQSESRRRSARNAVVPHSPESKDGNAVITDDPEERWTAVLDKNTGGTYWWNKSTGTLKAVLSLSESQITFPGHAHCRHHAYLHSCCSGLFELALTPPSVSMAHPIFAVQEKRRQWESPSLDLSAAVLPWQQHQCPSAGQWCH